MNILPFLAPSFELYLTLERVHPTRTYDYKKKGFANLPVIEVTHHGQKCKLGESWMYIATPVGARISSLKRKRAAKTLWNANYCMSMISDRARRGTVCT
jgi:hypothetical protein